MCVPRDAPFQLETCPLTAVDALGNSPVGPQHPSLCQHPGRVGGLGETLGGQGWGKALGGSPLNRVFCSPALLPGIPVVRGLCCVLGRRVPLHRGLLLCSGPGKGDQHCCVLVSAYRCLLHVSFQLWVGRREACGNLTEASCPPYIGSWLWTAMTQTSPHLGGGKQSLFALLGQAQLGGTPHLCSQESPF